ncbi:ABC transporter ATP-binding protein [Labedaea rhizosphaerae]|uniref:Putative ABC transport system ATP-binding protein n=1 Tax=Labedaea rhizosphaerae TaxID=598644 RepID=A0A4R6RRB8_LABRH|nr:ABC transporter ATP-binding protein [Labedaea rhizosphaerae]TDP89361.1 putative ABC transport system ATP-binding protein [Labedaea rhizosphaerae]
MTAPVRLDAVRKTYGSGAAAVTALAGVSVVFPAGRVTAVMGPSGSGKSTLLHCAAGLDLPTAGTVTLVGREIGGLNETQLTELRRDHVSFVFQSYNLMPALTVWDNTVLPSLLAGREPDRAWATEVLRRVGLGDKAGRRPAELSGGQQQRVAIARALASRSVVTFADEPTGALDSQTALDVLALLREVAAAGQTVIMVTHDPVAASYADTVLFIVDGQLAGRMDAPDADAVAARLAHLGARARQAVS